MLLAIFPYLRDGQKVSETSNYQLTRFRRSGVVVFTLLLDNRRLAWFVCREFLRTAENSLPLGARNLLEPTYILVRREFPIVL